MARRCCLLHLIKQNCLLKIFSNNSNLDDSGIYLPVFHSRTNLKPHISVSPKMVKKVIMNLDLSKASGPNCIPLVVLKNSQPEFPHNILGELFNKCLNKSCFPDCWKVSSVVPVFKNVGERPTTKNYRPVSLLSVVSKVFEKLLNNRIVDHLEKCCLFSDFQYGFRSLKKWLVYFNAGKTQLVSFDRSNNNGSIDVKMDGSVLAEKSSFKMLGFI